VGYATEENLSRKIERDEANTINPWRGVTFRYI
jgi:hypothetical protein